MIEHILLGIVIVLVLGISAQWLAWRFRIPSILLLLVFGFAAGPVTGLLPPASLQGDWLFAFVSLAIGIILFEGGLTLRLSELREVGRSVLNLITVGVLVTWALAGLAAYYIAGFSLSLAILIGAILTVTGPTVVIPLLRHVRPTGRVGTVAKWEGITIDPVGAILAVLVLETILLLQGAEASSFGDAALHALEGLMLQVFVSLGVSITGALLLVVLLRRRLVPDHLMTSMALAIVAAVFAISNTLQEESGLLATTLMGIFMANQPYASVKRIADFKEDLQVLLIASLFILLSARLDLSALAYINRQTLLFLVVLILVVRPVAVFISSLGTKLTWKEQVFMSWLAPRGIVAAAVASLFAFRLREIYPDEVGAIVPLIFLVIVGTVAVYGLTISPLARYLGLAEPNAQGVLFVGAHAWVRKVAKAVQDLGFQVLLIDSNAKNVDQAESEGLPAETANALDEDVLDELNLGGIGRILAVTPNDEVNALAALHFTELFETNDVYQLAARPGSREQTDATLPQHLRGLPLFDANTSHQSITRAFNDGAEVHTFEISDEETLEVLEERYKEMFTPLFLKRGGDLQIFSDEVPITPEPGDQLIAFVPTELKSKELSDKAPFEQLVAHAFVIDVEAERSYADIEEEAAALLSQRLTVPAATLIEKLRETARQGGMPIQHGAALPHCRLPHIDEPQLVMVRCRTGLCIEFDGMDGIYADISEPVYAIFFIVSSQDEPRRHLHTLANIASRIDNHEQFLAEWRAADSEQELKETLLHHDRFLSLHIDNDLQTSTFVDKALEDLDLPSGSMVALVHRGTEIKVPTRGTIFQTGDRITVIGEPAGIHRLYNQYRDAVDQGTAPQARETEA